ncbi:histone-lysine N-methyltransferase set-1-like isoform X2 [Pecten maximus]|uniref:histone-lysine N-methyltransferase set-1-like isoform X2 n=1 Tax=Pecten maximus TaxID=6579 RepID=UPI00145914D0|nr:histone-lysine N-methyltransferase set-1-like isoform X2 [Pecten maximus]
MKCSRAAKFRFTFPSAAILEGSILDSSYKWHECVNMNLRKRKQSWKENEEEIDKNGLHLYIKTSTGKGVYAGKAIEAGEDICRYQGMVQETDPADEDDTYVFEINFKGKKLWVNATKEDDTFGRLINDNHKNPNCRAKVFESDG